MKTKKFLGLVISTLAVSVLPSCGNTVENNDVPVLPPVEEQTIPAETTVMPIPVFTTEAAVTAPAETVTEAVTEPVMEEETEPPTEEATEPVVISQGFVDVPSNIGYTVLYSDPYETSFWNAQLHLNDHVDIYELKDGWYYAGCYSADTGETVTGYIKGDMIRFTEIIPPTEPPTEAPTEPPTEAPTEKTYSVYFTASEILANAGLSVDGTEVIAANATNVVTSNGTITLDTKNVYGIYDLSGIIVSNAGAGAVTVSGNITTYGGNEWGVYQVNTAYFSVTKTVG